MTAEHDPAPLAGLVALFTPGDTTEAYQDASSYLPARTQLTPLGAVRTPSPSPSPTLILIMRAGGVV